MPIDKVVDSAVLDANLLSVANAIRDKAGTSEDMAFPDGFVSVIEAISAGGGMPEGMNAFLFTMTETYANTADGWTLVIPHGLNVAPKFAVVLSTAPITNASLARGWFGNADETAPENVSFSGLSVVGKHETVSIRNETATKLYVDAENLYCKSGSWGGQLAAGTTLMVGVCV